MPCDTIQVSKITWGPNTDPKLLAAGLDANGYTSELRAHGTAAHRGRVELDAARLFFRNDALGVRGNYNIATNTLEMFSARGTDTTEIEASMKRAYSVQVVQATAKKMGWTITQKSNTQFAAQRRF